MPRLRVLYYRTLPSTEEAEIEAHELKLELQGEGNDGGGLGLLATLKARITSLTGLTPEEQHLAFGDAAHPIEDDVDVRAFLPSGPSSPPSSSSTLHVLRKPELLSIWRGEGGSCTRLLFGDRALLQPAYVIPGSDEPVCHACSVSCFPPGLLMDAVGAPLKPFACTAPQLCAQGLGCYVFEGAPAEGSMLVATTPPSPSPIPPPPALALLSKLEEQALVQQALAMPTEQEAQGLVARLRGGQATVLAYEDATLQAKALQVIPLAELHHRALAAGGDPQRRPAAYSDTFFRELLAWFKRDFFQWVNNPPCDGCGSAETELVGGAAPTPAEAAGRAGRVEVYKCKKCSAITRFPRYNDPGKLLETRRGRCGEWANCFTLCCRAVGLETRYVLDWTDHVWTEVYSEAECRWLHADCCENLADNPLVYEAGWGKSLSYVVAFGRAAAVDVTRRYTRQYHGALLARRTEAPEAFLARQLASLNASLRASSTVASIAWRQVDVRLRREQYELRSHTWLGTLPLKASELQGRVSGDAVWKRIRGEDGKGAGSLSAGAGGGSGPVIATCTVTLAAPATNCTTDASRPPPAPIIEREEVAGLPLFGPSFAGSSKPPSLLVALTSTGASDLMMGAGAFGPEAITLNGLGVAVGTRGLNLVVIDLARGMLERSVAIDAAVGDGSDGTATATSSSPVQVSLARFLAQVPKGRMVIAVVLGSGHALGDKGTADAATWGQGGFPPLHAPVQGQAWLVVGEKEKDGGGTLQPWAQAVARGEARGPAKLAFTVPLNPTAGAAVAVGEMRWDGGIAALPLLHDMGPAGDGVIDEGPQAVVMRLKGAYPHLPICGYSYKQGYGLAVFGPTSGIRGGGEWTTVRTAPASVTHGAGEEGEEQDKEDVKAQIKRAFDGLVAQGLAPNVAAAQALVAVKQEAEARARQREEERQRAAGQGLILSWTERVGGTTRPADGEAWAFDDAELALPLAAAAECGQAFPPRRLAGVRLWASARGVQAIQAGYATADATEAIQWAPSNRPLSSLPSSMPPTATLTIGPEDRLVRVDVRPGAEGVEALRLTTQRGQTVLCGRRDEPSTVSVSVQEGLTAVALFGVVGREGLQSVGLVQARVPSASAATATTGPVLFPWGVYTTCAVDRATRQMLLWGCDDKGEQPQGGVLQALQAAKRYLGNCLNAPANAAFRRIRCRTGYFHQRIGKRPGSGHLMRALGFQHVAAAAVGSEEEAPEPEACYELPLARASPVMLERLMARLEANIARLEALLAKGAEA